MANPLDAGARLAEGRPVVDDLSEYVLACHRLGYQNPDLTAHVSQVRDWYDAEAGLDLRGLDADRAALAAVADAAEDAARTQTALVTDLSDAWSGGGATAAREFARHSGQAATSVASALRGAADALATLRDELWRAIDAKVTTVQAIDGRHRAARGEWLAAARTVATGAGDLATASELVDRQVKPFVQNDVGSDFVGAMRAAATSIGAAYDAATARTSSASPATFDVPGELGPRATFTERPGADAATTTPAASALPPPAMVGTRTAAAAFTPTTAPAAVGTPWPGPAPAVMPPGVMPAGGEQAATAPSIPAAAAAPAASSMPSAGDLGGAAPAVGTGITGFGQQLADLIGSLVGSPGGTEDLAGIDGMGDDSGGDPLGGPDEETEPDEEVGEDDEDDEDESSPDAEPEAESDEPIEGPPDAATGEAPAESVPEPTPVAPPLAVDGVPVPPAAPESVAETAENTPCEIAADELPQVGE